MQCSVMQYIYVSVLLCIVLSNWYHPVLCSTLLFTANFVTSTGLFKIYPVCFYGILRKDKCVS